MTQRGTPEVAFACSPSEQLRRQLLQQRLRLLQIARTETLSEPPVNRSQQFARFLHLLWSRQWRARLMAARSSWQKSLQATIPMITPPPMASRCIRADTGLQQKNPSRRSRTRSCTPHDTPPKEAAAHRVIHKNMQLRAALSRTATALAQWHWSCGICSWRGPIELTSKSGLTPTHQSAPSIFQIARVAFGKATVHRSEQFARPPHPMTAV